ASLTISELKDRAAAIGVGEVAEMDAAPGGGSLPTATIPSAGLVLGGDHSAALRAANPPIIARVNEDRTHLDLRTVSPDDDAHIKDVVAHLC
ncbi:MAG: L-seryl-tRNA(Sec) selenium transferase, partial [Actinomycetota bacterium]|nr:L-seryl-tRNA(Sec) selenium transferase [Actinomycetota bacterium]